MALDFKGSELDGDFDVGPAENMAGRSPQFVLEKPMLRFDGVDIIMTKSYMKVLILNSTRENRRGDFCSMLTRNEI